MFRLDKLTQKAQEALQQAQAIAEKQENQILFPLHLLIALAEEKEGIVRPVLEKCNVHPDAIVSEARRLLGNLPKQSGLQPGLYLSQPMNQVLEKAFDEATHFKDEFVSTEHLLLAVADYRQDPAGQLLDHAGATHDAILKALVSVRGTQRITDQNPESKYQALERYAHDLTESARQGKLDPVIGRDDEIRRVMQVLSRRTKNNPVLIGEPGVGKTAIVEGLAQRIVRGDVPDQLKNKKLVAIDLGSMIAGTKFRGEFEDRKAVVKEIIDSNGEIICFIDEMHTIVGAGSAEGAIDAANLLKPALARGELRCIGATTLTEYKKHVEKDAALARRFRTVMVGEPTVDDTVPGRIDCRPLIARNTATATNTIAPPTSVLTPGTSLNTSQTQSGDSGASSEPISAVSTVGRNRAPSVKRPKPTAELTMPNRASSPIWPAVTSSGCP